MVTNNSCNYDPTQYNVQTGGASGALNNVAPSATSGVPLISQGASSQPAFGTAVVAGGGTGATTLTGILTGNGTSAITANAVTQYGTVIAGASNAVSSVAPSATSGVPLISQGSSANPTYGTAVVAGGGTGATSFTAYAVLTGGTTSTNPIQSIASVGTAGQVLVSNGAGALPTFQTPAYVAPPYYFYAQLSADALNATGDGTDFVIKCDTIVKNVGSAYAAGTGLFTAPVAGMYHFDANFQIQGVVTTHSGLIARIIQTSPALGIANFVMNPYPLTWAGQLNFSISCTYGLALGATIYIDIIVLGTGKTIKVNAGNTNFQGYYVGP